MAFIDYILNLDLSTSLQMLDRHLWGELFLGPPHLHFLFRGSDLSIPGLVIRGIIRCRSGCQFHADWRCDAFMMCLGGEFRD